MTSLCLLRLAEIVTPPLMGTKPWWVGAGGCFSSLWGWLNDSLLDGKGPPERLGEGP